MGELSISCRNYGNSENATIRARLRAEAMSRAVSSMVAVLFRFGRLFPLTNLMQFGCQVRPKSGHKSGHSRIPFGIKGMKWNIPSTTGTNLA